MLKRINWGALPLLTLHLSPIAIIWTGVSTASLITCVALFWLRMFGATAGYHRYFSHRSYKTSRIGQFVLALIAMSGVQRGVLWWASHHRKHHRYSDKPEDVHSPLQKGVLYAHFGWLLKSHTTETDYASVQDLSKYWELRMLERVPHLPGFLLGLACTIAMGWQGLVVGFLLSTMLLHHGTFTINSLAHVWGSRRFATTDDSRNNFFLALLTLGEGWHNNHHHHHSSCRQGFAWYEIDIDYYILRALAVVGIVWDLREPPARIMAEARSRRSLPRSTSPALPAETQAARMHETHAV